MQKDNTFQRKTTSFICSLSRVSLVNSPKPLTLSYNSQEVGLQSSKIKNLKLSISNRLGLKHIIATFSILQDSNTLKLALDEYFLDSTNSTTIQKQLMRGHKEFSKATNEN